MMMRKFAATAAMLVAAVGVAAGTANADPAAPAPPLRGLGPVEDPLRP